MSILNIQTGGAGEELAKKYLEERGFCFIRRNFYTRFGEIDLIMQKEGILYFIEVKTRRTKTFGFPEESVTQKKLIHMHKAALQYQQVYHTNNEKRFLIVAILIQKSLTDFKLFEV